MIFDREGKVSVFKVGLLALGLGLLLIAGAGVAFVMDRASRQVPLDVSLFPGAVTIGTTAETNASRTQVYQVPETAPEQVLAHYQTQMNSFYGADAEPEFRNCKRFPSVGNQAAYDRGDPNVVPYQYVCLFDRSGFNASQLTNIIIQPGINADSGSTVIAYQQSWQP